MLVFGTQIHIVTFIFIVWETGMFFFQLSYYSIKPQDKNRILYLILYQNQKLKNKIDNFIKKLSKRLQNCQLECADVLYIIKNRDNENSFFYCDPPYFNSNMGHYDDYSEQDFENLLSLTSKNKREILTVSISVTDINPTY